MMRHIGMLNLYIKGSDRGLGVRQLDHKALDDGFASVMIFFNRH